MYMKILIIRFSSIGDIVLTTPVIRCLKKRYPTAELHFCTKRKYEDLLRSNPYIDKFHYLENSLGCLTKQLIYEKFDVVIDLHNSLRSNLIKPFLGSRVMTYNKLNLRKYLYVKFKMNTMPVEHVVDRYMQAIHSLGVTNDNRGLDHFVDPSEDVLTEIFPIEFQSGFVAYITGGDHYTKRLPVQQMITLCRQIDKPIILIGGQADRARAQKVCDELSNYRIFNACGLYTINESASIVKKAFIVFSHDTGLMHIAAAYKKSIISIWGGTTPILGMYPYLTSFEVVEHSTLACRPCSKNGRGDCPQKHFNCMNGLNFTPMLLATGVNIADEHVK